MKQETSKIEGMTCSACASRIERVVKKLEGVENASVNFASETLSVTYDEGITNISKVKAAVDKAGFKLIGMEEKKEEVKKHSEDQVLFYRYCISRFYSATFNY